MCTKPILTLVTAVSRTHADIYRLQYVPYIYDLNITFTGQYYLLCLMDRRQYRLGVISLEKFTIMAGF